MKRLDASLLWAGRGSDVLEGVSLLIDEEGRIAGTECSSRSGSGYFVMPSFVDSHCHFLWMGLAESMPDLSRISTAEQMLELVASEAARGEGILQCERFDESTWENPVLPSLVQLDAATGDRPTFLRRVCGHMAILNSAMIRLLPEDTPDLDRINGILTEDMVINFNTHFPPSEETLEQAVHDASSMAFSRGVTAIGTMESWKSICWIRKYGTSVRLSVSLMYQDLDHFLESLPEPVENDIRFSGVKLFLDGAIGARNAAVATGYIDAPPGKLIYSDEVLKGMLERIMDLGLVPTVHAIGGSALRQLDRVSSAVLASGGSGNHAARLRVEHAEELMPAWPGTWDPGVHLFSMQPNFVSRWQMPGSMYYSRLEFDSALHLNPFAPVSEAGFVLGFGSDNMPFGPLEGLAGATRHPVPEFRLSCFRALEAYTLGSAELCGFDELAHPLGKGRPADLVVLSDNPLDSKEFSELSIVATIRDGTIMYGPEDLLVREE
jgi:predicted amidohydrolase YtcJ